MCDVTQFFKSMEVIAAETDTQEEYVKRLEDLTKKWNENIPKWFADTYNVIYSPCNRLGCMCGGLVLIRHKVEKDIMESFRVQELNSAKFVFGVLELNIHDKNYEKLTTFGISYRQQTIKLR